MEVRTANPYRPGFNQPPVVFAGRTDVIDGAREALHVAALDGRTPRPIVLLGPRGVGKTVTLGEIADLALQERSWPHVHVEAKASGGLVDELCLRLDRATDLLEGRTPPPEGARPPAPRARVATVSATVLGVGGAVGLDRGAPVVTASAAARVGSALARTMGAAVRAEAGLVLTLDELQVAEPAEVAVLAGTLQESVPEDWPLVTALAALPTLRTGRGRRQLPTYLERAEWHELGALDLPDAREALTEPARRSGRPFEDAAAELLLEVAGGYPYALQVAGHFAWRASHGAASIGPDHVRAAIPRIEADLAQLFRSRWSGASNREREYLEALAALEANRDGGPAPRGGDVAAALGKPATKVSYLRDRLLKKGTLYTDASGALHFIAPGMGEWIRQERGLP